ncbi:MAG: GTP-binding protein, partial [Acidobacteriota bacterium]
DDIINAKTLYQAKVAARQRSGSVSKQINPIKTALTDIIVQLETALEFVDEDISTESLSEIKKRLSGIRFMLRQWIDSFRMGRIIREGFNLAVIGIPNVGKSSVFNALLLRDRSIVMDLPGTTRDLISDDTSIDGVPVRLLDTAGIHDSKDVTEKIGMDRSYKAIADADAVLFVVDTSVLPCGEDFFFHRELKGRKRMVVFNKSDLVSKWSHRELSDFSGDCSWIQVSAKTGERIEELRSMIFKSLLGIDSSDKDDVLITNLRHCHCLEAVQKEIDHALAALEEGLSEEFTLMHLHKGLKELGAITGETSIEDLLDVIFSRFCIGK